jgi:hypothetical protein
MERIVVFDMDETLGTFVQINLFIIALIKLVPSLDHTTEFYKVMKLFSVFHRPYIVRILKYVCLQRDNGNINRIVLYTNNTGDPLWVRHITSFFETQTNCKIFDDHIFAYNVNGKIIDNRRTTNNKTVNDLYKCLKLKSRCDICFIDDQIHSEMIRADVTYIHVPPYKYMMNYHEMALLYHNRYPLYDKNKFIHDITSILYFYGNIVTRTTRQQLEAYVLTSEHLDKCIREFCRNR